MGKRFSVVGMSGKIVVFVCFPRFFFCRREFVPDVCSCVLDVCSRCARVCSRCDEIGKKLSFFLVLSVVVVHG